MKSPQHEPFDHPFDRVILGFDQALKTLTGQQKGDKANPAEDVEDQQMDLQQRQHAAGLMRVNHSGEICAQALYEGQALTAKSEEARVSLLKAAKEERDHLSWCSARLSELEAKPSVLDPLFYGVAYFMGAATGLAGDRVSLGFVEATEDQVVQHLDEHLEELPQGDRRSRAILQQMRQDEAQHGAQAMENGGAEFPQVVKKAMTALSRLMTVTSYRT